MLFTVAHRTEPAAGKPVDRLFRAPERRMKMTTKTKKLARKVSPPEPTPLPWDVFPPTKCAIFENGKLIRIESFDDPRKRFCELFNEQQERLEQAYRERGIERVIRRAGPIQEDPEDWTPEMAEQYLVDMLARVRKAKRAAARKAGKAVRT